MTDAKTIRHYLPWIALLGVLWGPTNYAVKIANASASPLAVASLRWWVAGVLLMGLVRLPAFARATNLRWPDRKEQWVAFAMGMIFFAPSQALYPLGLRYTTSIEATVLLATGPLWTALMATVLLREKIAQRTWAMISVGLVGAYLVAVGFQLPRLSQENTFGNAIYLGAFVWECIAWVWLSGTAKRSSGIGTLVPKIAGAMVSFALLSLTLRGDLGFAVNSVTPSLVASIGFLVLVPALLCFSLWYVLVEKAPIALMSVTTIIQPIVGAFLGWWLLREEIGVHTAVGSVIVLGALGLGAREKVPPPEA